MADYYAVLGIDKKASKDEVKKAFRTLAHKYHPDKKGGDEKKFKELSEAYAVLSDDKRRAEYDRFGNSSAGGSQGGFSGFDGFDFSQFSGFRQGGGFEINIDDLFGGFSDAFSGGRGRKAERRGRDVSIDLLLSFKESIFGVERRILLTRDINCSRCTGSGAEPGSKLNTCGTCSGKGTVVESQRSPFGVFSVSRECTTCKGRKTVPEKSCTTCKGRGVERKEGEVTVGVPPGIEDGQVMRMAQMGEALLGGTPGDLYIQLHVTPDAKFRRDGFNLVTELSIQVTEALLGATKTVESLDGQESLTITPLKSVDEIVRIKGKGVPDGRGKRGDLLVRLKVGLPQKITKNAQELLRKLKEEGM